MNGDTPTLDEYVAETLERLPAKPADAADVDFTGETPDWFGPTLFGGFVVGQATSAIAQSAPEGFEIHSLHAYFLSALRSGPSADYTTESLRDGRGFVHRSLHGSQQGRPFVSMIASFTTPDRPSDFEYGRRLDPSVPRPDDVEVEIGNGPWDSAHLDPPPAESDGFLPSSSRSWFRFGRSLPDEPRLHASLLAYATDMTGAGARPLLMDENSVAGIVSLDHAVHFHRPARVDDWLFYDVTATVNTGGRGYLRGQIYDAADAHVASVVQETLLWDPRPDA